MIVKDIADLLEKHAPLSLQESYDNSGLQIGNPQDQVESALICLDITIDVVDEAIQKGCNMIISHHPLLFSGIKKITGRTYIEKIVHKAIKNDIVIYSAHTHFDNIKNGVNKIFAEKIGLTNLSILKPISGTLRKLVTFCPVADAEKVRNAIFSAGAGNIGNYDSCSSNTMVEGTFRANTDANPYVGSINELHHEKEIRIETIYPYYLEKEILKAMLEIHPYEEVAYDIYALQNDFNEIGAGMIGELAERTSAHSFMKILKETLQVPVLRYSGFIKKDIQKIAICGGSGAFLIKDAIAKKADVFITSDIKYHTFGDHSEQVILIDAGHFETEQFTKHLLCDILKKNFPNFATQISEQDNNLLRYFI
ncbi:MAG: Nif3-like dinuclear metal center hexameric protein [Bacteroidota bacterium]